MPRRSDSGNPIEVEVRSYRNGVGQDRWFVYWETPNFYGSRGAGLSREAADKLAEKIRKDGPAPGACRPHTHELDEDVREMLESAHEDLIWCIGRLRHYIEKDA